MFVTQQPLPAGVEHQDAVTPGVGHVQIATAICRQAVWAIGAQRHQVEGAIGLRLATVVEPQDVQRSTVEQPPAVAVRGDADQVLADEALPEARAPLGQARAVRVETDHHLAAAVDDGQRAIRGNGKPG